MRRILALVGLVFWAGTAMAEDRSITLASTTSTQNSGLFAAILPVFEAQTGIQVNVVAVGTGQAIRIARNGDADALLVHHRPSEDAFVAEGHGIERRDVMYNDFVIIGPRTDPAGVHEATGATDAFMRIAAAEPPFVSRGDDSGTHLKEREIWQRTGLQTEGAWYLETGAGMGTTLNVASAMDAYVLSDRGTWLTFGNKGGLTMLFSGDPALFNPYGIILVNPGRHRHVKVDLARRFADWLTAPEGQAAIGAFRVNGFQAFCPSTDIANIGENPACPVGQ